MPHYDLVIIGTGSGNSIPGPEFDDWWAARNRSIENIGYWKAPALLSA